MADEGFRLAEDDELQITSSLASLHLRDEAAAIDESDDHMGNNPEPRSVFSAVTSSPLNQSQQQTDISMATRPEPSPAAQGKTDGALRYFLTSISV